MFGLKLLVSNECLISLGILNILLIFCKLPWDLEGKYKHNFKLLHSLPWQNPSLFLIFTFFVWGRGEGGWEDAHADNPLLILTNTHTHYMSGLPFPHSRHLMFMGHFIVWNWKNRQEREEEGRTCSVPLLGWDPWMEGLAGGWEV